jgi:hypothetical protein
MEDIFLDRQIDIDCIKNTLSKIFPGLEVFHYDFLKDEPASYDSENPKHIIFNTAYHSDKKEFGFVISIYRTPKDDNMERQLYIGRAISEEHKVRVIVPYNNPEDPKNPYYDIIFENHKSYLADDSDTNFGDNTEGLVKIIREYDLPPMNFNSIGEFIK